jgi:hypothetical protein
MLLIPVLISQIIPDIASTNSICDFSSDCDEQPNIGMPLEFDAASQPDTSISFPSAQFTSYDITHFFAITDGSINMRTTRVYR